MATKPQTTVFVSGLGDSTNESTLLQYFSPFGEVMDVQLPRQRHVAESSEQVQQSGGDGTDATTFAPPPLPPHRGFAFVVYATEQEAEDAIDNMNLNEIDGRIVGTSIAKPSARDAAGGDTKRAIWDDEDWIKEHGGGAPDADAPSIAPETEMTAA